MLLQIFKVQPLWEAKLEEKSWIDEIIDYIAHDTLPQDREQSRVASLELTPSMVERKSKSESPAQSRPINVGWQVLVGEGQIMKQRVDRLNLLTQGRKFSFVLWDDKVGPQPRWFSGRLHDQSCHWRLWHNFYTIAHISRRDNPGRARDRGNVHSWWR